jgi:hypothetical protein
MRVDSGKLLVGEIWQLRVDLVNAELIIAGDGQPLATNADAF